jgi:hypothetical protein
MPGTRGRFARILSVVLATLTVALLAGCGELSKSLAQTVRASVTGGPDVPVSPADVASRPLFQVLAVNEYGKALLILGNVQGHQEIWYGPRGSAVFLDRGRVVKTANLARNLDGSRITGPDPFASGLHRLAGPIEFESIDDWSPGYQYGIPVRSRLTPAGRETVEILGKPRELLRVDEAREAGAGGWHATAHFWVDPETGFIWKSVQQLGPGMELTLTQLKPRLAGGPP